MISRDVIRYIDYGVLGALGVFILVCLLGLASTAAFPAFSRLPKATQTFYGTWPGRLCLSALGALLLASQLLRMSSLWGLTGESSLSDPGTQGVLCRVYLTVSPGLLQPWFLLTALLLCRYSVSRRVQLARASDSLRLVALALVLTLPVTVLQTVLAWLSVIFASEDWDADRSTVGHYFFAAYDVGSGEQCDAGQEDGCVLCIFPAASTIVLMAFTLLFSLALFRFTTAMARGIINRRLRLRLQVMQLTMLAAMMTQVVMAAVSVISPPWTWLFEVCWLVYVGSMAALVFTVEWILVVSPVWAVYAAQKSLVRDGEGFATDGDALGALGEHEMRLLAKGTGEAVMLV